MDLLDNVEGSPPHLDFNKTSRWEFSKRINILKCDPLTETQMSIRLSGQVNGEKNNYGRKETGNRTEMII